jgi:hypothetical protein
VSATSTAGGILGRGIALIGRRARRSAVSVPRSVYFAASDLAEYLPKLAIRPWYFAAALIVIAAVAGVPYAKSHWITAKPAVGSVRVESARTDALVSIDGVPQGRAPVTVTVPVGRHRVEVQSGGQTRAHDVDVTAGSEALVISAGADLSGMGSIRVTSDPAGAEVRLDGVLQGNAPLTIDNVPEGAHTVQVRNGSGSVRQSVRVRAEDTVDATLQIRPGWLAVFAPVKLDILENGRSIGSTERGRILTPPGAHTLELVGEAVGFRESRQVEIKPGEVAAITIQMPPATIEIAAPADSEILVDGQSIGTAPLGTVRVAVGTREITMRHPALGERRQVVSVTYKSTSRVVFE